MIQEQYLSGLINNALDLLNITNKPHFKIEIPKNVEHGDVSTNVAMLLSKELRKAPQAIAQEIIEKLNHDTLLISNVSIAGAGFINFKFTNKYYHTELNKIIISGKNYGKQTIGEGNKVNVEYVSANPTGLLHLGHGRNAAIGDTIANLYNWLGYEVTREYYFNNAGNQMNNLAKSIYARYMELCGELDFPFPEDGYHGEYIRNIAQEVLNKFGSNLKEYTPENALKFQKEGENWNFTKIKETMNLMKVEQDLYFNEDSLYKEGKIEETIEKFRKVGLAYDKEGAIWLKLSELGQETDKVIVKSSGEPTYRLPDIAYHVNKLERGYDLVVDIFGADHIATIPDVIAGVKALGFDSDKIKVLIYQFVTLTENGEQVKMSKRSGKSYTLDELLNEVGADVVRFFLLMRSCNTHLEFDLSLAKDQSDKNPVFYLQYAHARICSVLDLAESKEINFNNANIELLNDIRELALIKELLLFPFVIKNSAEKFEPHSLAEYLKNVAASYHNFYHDCRIITDDLELSKARLQLSILTKIVLYNGLSILGISQPERM